MYWNNSWVNYFNKKNFFNKTLFFENIFLFLFSDKIFNFFFTGKLDTFKETTLFKNFFLKKVTTYSTQLPNNKKKFKKIVKKKVKYNFTRVWFVKYGSYILLSTFVFFYFKIKKKTNKQKFKYTLKKNNNIFFKKKQSNFKKNYTLLNNQIDSF